MQPHRLPRWLSVKEPTWQSRWCRRPGFDPWVRRFPGGGNGNPLQYSCLENSMYKGTWQAVVHRVTKDQTWLSNWACMHTYSFMLFATFQKYQKQGKDWLRTIIIISQRQIYKWKRHHRSKLLILRLRLKYLKLLQKKKIWIKWT